MMKIWKILPTLAPVLAVGGVAAGAAAGLGSYTVPAYGAEEFRIPGGTEQVSQRKTGEEKRVQQPAESAESAKTGETKGEKTKKEKSKGSFQLADGTYEGTGTGYHGEIKVSVNIQDQSIDAIDVLSHSDDEAFFNRAKEGVVGSILTRQTTEVDTVTGATYSSNGIINAVKNALSGAESPAEGIFPYPDGTYTGTGEGFGGKITVKVRIKKKAIVSVVVKEHADEDDGFFNRAKTLVDQIVKNQSVDIDAVSGATYSSKGILEAVRNALKATEKAAVTGVPSATDTPAATGSPSAGNTPAVTGSPSAGDTPAATGTPPVTESPAASGTPLPSPSPGLDYKDGLYTASALCSPDEYWDFDPYNLNLTVVLSGGRITAIRNIYGDYEDDAADNDSYVNRAANGSSSAPGVVSQIVEKNSAEGIDTVSHATCSSRAIIEACRQALLKAQ